MKKTILQLVLTIINCTLLFAQESKLIDKGFTTSGLNSEFNYFTEKVNPIEDGEKKFVYEKNKSSAQKIIDSRSIDTVIQKKQIQKLEFVNSYKILQNQQKISPDAIRGVLNTNPLSLNQYNTGKVLVDIGNIALGAGIGFIIGGGISNLNKASSTSSTTYSSGERSGGTPFLIITGIVIGCISVPLKIIGRNNIKESIELYNLKPYTLPKTKDISLVLFAKNNSVGLCYRF